MILTGIIIARASFTSVATKERANTFEGNIQLFNKEIAEQEQKNKEEKARQYSIYSKYELTYDQEKDRFFYNGKLVRFFADKLDKSGFYNSFSYADGDVDLRGIRNEKYELVGVEPVSQKEYDHRTDKIKTSFKNISDVIQENVNDDLKNDDVIIEVSDQNYVDDSLNSYIKYGISYDKEIKVWMYKDRPINFLYDEYNIAGISLEVIRDTNGRIEKIVEVIQ
ncbi:hypothetical protein KQI42_16190 [Tissierella sp. MSJ-40]|uniref:Uncharacterized protein n=1 Tax=Tissierella simiarum TaxID=2841534 RepID=A0ABS6EAV1_9FIRM|nr:hypothetical protein [Tissierella simiarum]MBU5439555.1 hypothetical protein [Tissierella simiarum]